MIKRSVVIAALFSSALEADELPEMPSALKDLKWTADFAVLIALRCEGFSLSPSGETANVPHVQAYLRNLEQSGVDLEKWQRQYQEPEALDGEIAVMLLEKGGVELNPDWHLCEIAEEVMSSEMLLKHFLTRNF